MRQYPELLAYPDETLRDIARNEACPYDYRMSAVERLVAKNSPYAKHEELADLVRELDEEMQGVPLVFPPPEPEPEPETPPVLKASVTTATMSENILPPDVESPEDATGRSA